MPKITNFILKNELQVAKRLREIRTIENYKLIEFLIKTLILIPITLQPNVVDISNYEFEISKV